jgi:hypothetical protein
MKPALRFLVVVALAVTADAQVEITLNNSFISEFQNRATITATYTVDKAHHKPNPASKDGDIHVAGRAPEIGLATVAEIMNAREEKPAMNAILAVEGTPQTVTITGAWRLWPEHAGGEAQIQGQELPKFTTTNPDHVFQIHPIITVNAIDVRDSFHPIDGFEPKDAENAFTRYENLRCRIMPGATTTKLMTNMAGFNYVEFAMDLVDEPRALADGTAVFASVSTLDGELLVRRRRMIFVKGTPPEQAVRTMHKGGHLHVLGIPRVDLALVAWRAAHANDRPEVLDWNLPYEIVVVGMYDDEEQQNE